MASWKGTNVFVTGASGLLGSAMVEELLDRGANVTCLVRDWVPASRLVAEGLVARCTVVRGELEDQDLILRALNEHEIECVFHLGAQTIVGTASRSPLSTFEANIRGTWILLDACRELSKLVKRVLVASSDKAYGVHERLPYTEDAPLQGRFPYDVSKSCTDLISLSYHATYGVPVAVTRCGNLYGAGDLNWNRLIPGTIRSLVEGERPIVRSDGKFVRDYFYVRDAVDAYLALAERLYEPKFHGQAFNFGTEEPKSVLEIVGLLQQACGRADLAPIVQNQASHEIPKQYLDCSKARAWLDWRPRRTLASGLAETVGWYRRALGA
ncbi:MAG: GDP-mannose 4,6-dehydratase [Planctomycetes bacterium]|nr:GDP-mannose 4,6-dehydratase [Planctomycetota bacterium]